MTASNELQTILPNGWSRAKGFSYGVAGGDRQILFVAGQLAVENGAPSPSADLSFSDQFAACLCNVVDVVRAAGGKPADVAVLRVFLTDMTAFKSAQSQIAVTWRKILGNHFPAMTMVEVKSLYEEHAMVEIEATAMLEKERTS